MTKQNNNTNDNILNITNARKSIFAFAKICFLEYLSYVGFFGTLVRDVVTLCKEIFCIRDVMRMRILIHPCNVQVLLDCA